MPYEILLANKAIVYVRLSGVMTHADLQALEGQAKGLIDAGVKLRLLVTLEAFEARRPVVTASDSGGVLEFVQHDVNGLVCPPDAAAIGACAEFLDAQPADQILALCGSFPGWPTPTFDRLRVSLERFVQRPVIEQ